MIDDDRLLFQLDSADWTPLWARLREEPAPFYVFHEGKVIENIQALRRRFGGVRLAYAMKSNPWLVPAASTATDRIEICSPGELTRCKAYGISSRHLIVDGPCTDFWEDALKQGCTHFCIDSPWHLRHLLHMAGKKPLEVLLRVTSGNQFGMDRQDLRTCVNLASQGAIRIRGIQFFSGTQCREPNRVRRNLNHLRGWIADCKEIPGLQLEEVEFGVGIGVPYFQGEEPEDYVELLNIVEDFIRDLQGCYQVTYEVGRLVTAACGIYVTEVAAQKRRGDCEFLFCTGGTNHLCYPGGILGVRVPIMRELCAHPSGIIGTHTVCGPLCSESDVLVRQCHTLDSGLTVGDKIVFFGAGAYTATEAPNLFLDMVTPRIMLYNKDRTLWTACDDVH